MANYYVQCRTCNLHYDNSDIENGDCLNCRIKKLKVENTCLQKDLIRAEANYTKQKPPPDIVPFEHLKDVSETIMEISESCTLLKFEELAKKLYKLANEVYQAAWRKRDDDDFESAIVWATQTIDKLLLEDEPDILAIRRFFNDTFRPNQDYDWFKDRLLKEWKKSIPIKNQTETQDV